MTVFDEIIQRHKVAHRQSKVGLYTHGYVHMNAYYGSHYTDPNNDGRQICEVWAHNLVEEFQNIRKVVERYPYIAMDTEFPGIVVRPTGNVTDYNYQTVKCNVDILKVIQIGVTFADALGNLPPNTTTWQFNFNFDIERDMYSQASIDVLKSSGMNFDRHRKDGIDVEEFGELIMSSGLVMNEDVKWVSFHGCYDFGYLLKVLTCENLPYTESDFFSKLHDFFPSLYDIKFLLLSAGNINFNGAASLKRVAEHLHVKRVGQQHQAGSDSLVTCRSFFKLMELYFDNEIDDSKYSGVVYGLGQGNLQKQALEFVTQPTANENQTYYDYT